MPPPLAVPSPDAGLTRRAALAGGLLATTTACSPYSFSTQERQARRQRPSTSVAPEPEVDPDVALAASTLAAEQQLVDLLAETARRHPRLRRTLEPLIEAHEAHVALLADAVPDGAAGDPSAEPSAEVTGGPARPEVSRDQVRAIARLARAEDELSLAGRRGAFAAESGAFARVLASMAACAAQHAATLRTGRVPAGPR